MRSVSVLQNSVVVSAVALVDLEGRVLITRRPAHVFMGGLWEFPGGKIEDNETPEACLMRELHEELAINVTKSCLSPLAFASHSYPEFHLLLLLYICRTWSGTPHPEAGTPQAWVRVQDMGDYPMPPANTPLIALLRDWI